MKRIKMSLIAAALAASPAAFADTSNFTGLSAGLNLNLITGGVKVSVDGESFDGIGGKQTESASLDFAYGFAIGSTNVLNVGIDIDLSEPKIYEQNATDANTSAKQKNRYGVYVAPGITVGKDTLVYGKLGYNRFKGEIVLEGTAGSTSFTGVSYGAGAKVMLSKNMFMRIEANRQTYSSKTLLGVAFKPSATVGTIGLGMKF